MLQTIRRLLIRPGRFRLERELPGGICTHVINAPCQGAPNNISEREIRPSVVFRKVTGGFRSEWGAKVHAGYRSITGTARLRGRAALETVRQFLDGQFAIA